MTCRFIFPLNSATLNESHDLWLTKKTQGDSLIFPVRPKKKTTVNQFWDQDFFLVVTLIVDLVVILQKASTENIVVCLTTTWKTADGSVSPNVEHVVGLVMRAPTVTTKHKSKNDNQDGYQKKQKKENSNLAEENEEEHIVF